MTLPYMDHGAWCSHLNALGILDDSHADCPESDECVSVERYRPLRLVKKP